MTNYAEVFPPGEFLKEELEARNWSQTEFAEIIDRPVRLINEIIAAKRAITPETAKQLGASLGTSPELWLNLESTYQLSRVQSNNSAIARRGKLHDKFPVREMTKRGWIEASKDISVIETNIKRFFGLKSLEDTPQLSHAARRTSYAKPVLMSQWAWLHRARQVADSFVVRKYDRAVLPIAIRNLKPCLAAAEELRHIPKILNDAGVRFVVIEALPGSKIDGACLWLEGEQPVIALSTRLDRIDNFWFVLRHELEHLLREHGKDASVMLDEDICQDVSDTHLGSEERTANEAAADFAVSNEELSNYMARVNPYFFAEDKVLGFAGRLGVHPGVVVGRLQKVMEHMSGESPYRFLRNHLVKVRRIVTQSAPTDGWGSVYPIR